MGGFIKANGVTVQQNVGVNVNLNTAAGTIAEDMANMQWLRSMNQSGYLGRLDAIATVVKEGDADGNGSPEEPPPTG